ncbi:MAG TPA: rhomboid family intramembrane serine protease [Steroidobacteraceae bacterium]|nr:rhomboid family intramembrane serine protease [Steroidobacteraceae bacterium]
MLDDADSELDPGDRGAAIEIYRSGRQAGCNERAFVLSAVGISSAVGFDGAEFLLRVGATDEVAARAQLQAYESESRAARIPVARVQAQLFPGAWIGCVFYVVILYGVALGVSKGWWRVDAFQRGELDGALVQSGQWWRAWTALTLHWDGPHLVANLGAGVWFGYLAARQLGAGTAWLLTVTGAAAANLFDAHFGPSSYLSVGASTAVFTALGLIAAHSWRTRYHLPQRWALRWAPLIAGLVLLGWFGSSGEGTDLVAHALGFITGCLLGALAALGAVAGLLQRLPQWLAGFIAVGSLAIAWACALAH